MKKIPYEKFKHGQRVTKTYKLLIDSPEYPKGTIAMQISPNVYTLSIKDINFSTELFAINIENRPTIWQLQEEKLDLRSPEAERMREEARSKRWEFIPNRGDRYYFSGIKNNGIDWLCWNDNGDTIDRSIWNTGNCHRTEEDAIAWSEKYARYFLTE